MWYIGLSIISNELLNSLCLTHFSDSSTYVELKINPLKDLIQKIRNELNKLHTDNQLCIAIKKLTPKNPRLGKVRILTKLRCT